MCQGPAHDRRRGARGAVAHAPGCSAAQTTEETLPRRTGPLWPLVPLVADGPRFPGGGAPACLPRGPRRPYGTPLRALARLLHRVTADALDTGIGPRAEPPVVHDFAGPGLPATADAPAGVGTPAPELRDITELYHAHRVELVRLGAFLVDDPEAAQDVVQDAFAAAYRRHGAVLTGVDDPLRYLRRSVVNGCRSVLRRRKTARAWVPPHLPPAPSPEDDAIRAEEDHQLRAAINNLRPRQREVLVMRYYGGLTEAEIARTLKVPQGTVKSTANRALKALHRMLETR